MFYLFPEQAVIGTLIGMSVYMINKYAVKENDEN